MLNKVVGQVIPDCEDARAYIQKILEKMYKNEVEHIDRFYMNLPADAIEFLDAFTIFYSKNLEFLKEDIFKGSLVHIYCFLMKDTEEGLKKQLVHRIRGIMPNLDEEDVEDFHILKSVSSEKEMVCVNLRLTSKNCGVKENGIDELNPIEKKIKVD